MQTPVVKLVYHLINPDEIRRGDVFGLETPYLSKGALVYFAKDIEAQLLAYAEYWKLPNHVLRMKPEEVKVGDCVEIMTSNI